MGRLVNYTLGSLFLTTWVVWHTATSQQMYFPTMMALVHSKVFNALAVNDGLLFVTWLFYGMRGVFFGKVREQEWDHVKEQMTYQIIQSLFALSYFHFPMTIGMSCAIIGTLATKAFHYLGSARLDTMEQSANVTTRNQLRFLSSVGVLFHIDLFMVYATLTSVTNHGFGVWVVLALDWALMLVQSGVLIARFVIHAVERNMNRRNTAAKYYLTLASTCIQCGLELAFVAVIWSHVGAPLHLLRELYITIRTLIKTLRSLVAYRGNCAIVDKCQVPTEAEIQRDPSCVICMEEMIGGGVEGTRTARKLPCSHVYHSHCLYRFVEKDHHCPVCRRDFVAAINAAPQQQPVVPPARPQPEVPVAAAAQPQPAPQVQNPPLALPTIEEMEAAFQEYRRTRSVSTESIAANPGTPITNLPRAASYAMDSPSIPSRTTSVMFQADPPVVPPQQGTNFSSTAIVNTNVAAVRGSSTTGGSPLGGGAVGFPGMTLKEVRAYKTFHTKVAAAFQDLENALLEGEQQ